MNALGQTARKMRERQGLTRAKLAEKAGLEAEWIRRLETGDLSQMDQGMASTRTLAAALGYSFSAFLREASPVDVSDLTPDADPGLRQLVADLDQLEPDERQAVEKIIRQFARRKDQDECPA